MYKRDIAIVFVAFFAVFFSLQHEGRISIRKAWYHEYNKIEQDLLHPESRLPPPVVGDLNGDGNIEVIVATNDYKIEVVKPRHAGRNGEGFAKSHVIASVSILPGKVAIPGNRKPAALAVGYIDPEPKELVRAPRKQVVVVVTAGWHIMCFDHNLKLLWERSAVDSLPHHAKLEEVAVHVSPHPVNRGDRGLVVVGGALLLGDLEDPDVKEEVLEEMLAEEAEGGEKVQASRRLLQQQGDQDHDRGEDGPFDGTNLGATASGVDISRHFSYYAFEGGSGAERWKHEASTFHPTELEQLADEVQPQNNFRLEAEKLQDRHFGEVSCREYRESVTHSMPHSWRDWHDTSLELAHFVKHKEGKGAQRHRLGKRTKAAEKLQPPGRIAGLVESHPFSALTGAQQKGRHQGGQHHHKGGRFGHGRNMTKANALVAHLREGIEVVQLYNGRMVCQLHLPSNQLHVDVNGDGVMDHVDVESGTTSVALGGGLGNSHHQSTHCTAVVRSGIPPRQELWRGDVCNLEQENFLDRIMEGGEQVRMYQPGEHVELPTPAFLPLPRLGGGYGMKGRQHGLLVFATNKGEVTAMSATGELVWTDFFATSWMAVKGGGGDVPTLMAMPMRPHAVPSAVLVVGSSVGAILSEHGSEVATFSVAFSPTHPAILADFNGDGLNDIMLVTHKGVFGYQQVHHLGGFPFSALVLTLVIAMALVYFTQQYDGTGAKGKRVRSTEYMD